MSTDNMAPECGDACIGVSHSSKLVKFGASSLFLCDNEKILRMNRLVCRKSKLRRGEERRQQGRG